MGNGKQEKRTKRKKEEEKQKKSFKTPKKPKFKKKNSKKNEQPKNKDKQNNELAVASLALQPRASAAKQLSFFINEFQSANKVQLSSLELESIKETCFVELSEELDQDVMALGKHMKVVFGSSWKEDLCEGNIVEGKVDPGSPAVLIISSSALRSIELLRGVRSLTKECPAVKLFSKHIKVEEQVGLLKNRVNFASGTPSRIKKLIDIEALGLSRLTVIVVDMHTDIKGYSLLTLPQVRDEFWDLYKDYFHQRLLQGNLRICLFGPIPNENSKLFKGKKKRVRDEQVTENSKQFGGEKKRVPDEQVSEPAENFEFGVR